MMSDKPKIVFVDLHGKEIFPARYIEPDMTKIAMPDTNGQLKVKPAIDINTINEMGAALW